MTKKLHTNLLGRRVEIAGVPNRLIAGKTGSVVAAETEGGVLFVFVELLDGHVVRLTLDHDFARLLPEAAKP